MVPNGWIHTTFEKHIDCLTGYAFKSSNYSDSSSDIKLLRGDNIEPGSLRWRDAKYWSINQLDGLERYQLNKGDFVIALDRTWISSGLKVAEVRSEDLPCLLVQRVIRVRAKKTLEQGLLRQYFSGHKFEQYVKSVQTATAVPHISPNDIKEFPLLLPPLAEQQKIAQILSTWDRAISATEKLLENSQQQKKALMQQLLTGKKRLLDENGVNFSEGWNEYSLGNLGNTFTGLTGKTKDDFGSGVPYITYMNIFKNSRIDINQVDYVVVKEDENQNSVRYGDIFFTTSSETAEEVGMSSVLLEEVERLYLNSFCFGFRLNNFKVLLPQFAAYILRSSNIRKQISILGQGATRYNLSKNQLMKLILKLPTIAEQKKIAEILTLSDQEIKTLQKKLDYLKQEKKALMQQLLTGKKRVKVAA